MIARDASDCEETAQELLKVGNAEMNGQSTENSRAATENSRRMLWAGLAERIRSDARNKPLSATARGHSSSLAAACLAQGQEFMDSWTHQARVLCMRGGYFVRPQSGRTPGQQKNAMRRGRGGTLGLGLVQRLCLCGGGCGEEPHSALCEGLRPPRSAWYPRLLSYQVQFRCSAMSYMLGARVARLVHGAFNTLTLWYWESYGKETSNKETNVQRATVKSESNRATGTSDESVRVPAAEPSMMLSSLRALD